MSILSLQPQIGFHPTENITAVSPAQSGDFNLNSTNTAASVSISNNGRSGQTFVVGDPTIEQLRPLENFDL